MKELIMLIVVTIMPGIITFPLALAQGTDKENTDHGIISPYYAPPENDTKYVGGGGVGLGISYGFLGANFTIGTERNSLNLGLGTLPYAGEFIYSIGSTVYFNNRYSTIRPKLSVYYSNAAAASMILQEDPMKSLYDELFNGVGVYLGADWRLSKTSAFCIDFNIGWAFPFKGYDEIERRWDSAVDDLRLQGFYVEDEKLRSKNTVDFSIGIVYSFGRKLVLHY